MILPPLLARSSSPLEAEQSGERPTEKPVCRVSPKSQGKTSLHTLQSHQRSSRCKPHQKTRTRKREQNIKNTPPGRKEEPLKSYKRTLGDKERKRRLGCRTFAAQQPNDVVIFVVVVGRRRRKRMIPGMPGPNIHTHLEEPIPGPNLTSFISIIYELIL